MVWEGFPCAAPSVHQALSAGHERVPKSEGYLNRSLPGVRKGGIKGEVKKGEVVGDRTGPEGEGINEGKG